MGEQMLQLRLERGKLQREEILLKEKVRVGTSRLGTGTTSPPFIVCSCLFQVWRYAEGI